MRACLPGVLGQVHVGRVQGSLKLLLFGGELFVERLDFVALLDCLPLFR